jgi:SsrA-binding protein
MKSISIKNKKAYFKYEVLDTYISGVVLQGTEIKSIRDSKISFTDAYCFFINNELFLKSFHISEYKEGTYNNHEPKRDRKLLLTKRELRRLKDKVKEGGLTIIPLKIFINEKGLCKFEIGLCKGKKNFDKRQSKFEQEENIRIKRDFKLN